MDPLLLQVGSSQNGALFVRCALYLLIVAEGKVNVEIWRKALFQEFLYRIHFRSEHGLTIFGAPSPETAFLHFSPKRRVAPLLLMNSRHHVLMSHEQYRILLRMVRFPVEKKTGLSDSGERKLFKNQRPGLLHVLVKAVKLGPVRVFIIHRRNCGNLHHSLEMGNIFFKFCIHYILLYNLLSA